MDAGQILLVVGLLVVIGVIMALSWRSSGPRTQ